MIERAVALRILGLSENAAEAEIQAAYDVLRAHVVQRLDQATSEAMREERRSEIRDLARVRESLSGSSGGGAAVPNPVETRPGAKPVRRFGPVPRWLLGWAVIATLTAALLLAVLAEIPLDFGPSVLAAVSGRGSGGGEGGGFAIDGTGEPREASEENGSAGSADVQSAGPRGEIVAHSSVEGALLRLLKSSEPQRADAEVAAEGAADDTTYYLTPGDYVLEVSHPDCPERWEREIRVSAGERRQFAPEVCRATGWMVVRSEQDDDQLSIDGRRVDTSADERHALSAGEHEVRVEREGHEPWEGVVSVEPGQVMRIRPRLRVVEKPSPQRRPQQPVAAVERKPRAKEQADLRELGGWHEEATQWLLARYDDDRSGALDSEKELAEVPCAQWLGLEQSHDASGLGLSLSRFYGFDGDGWKDTALGVGNGYRDVAYQRMKECGLR